MRRSPTGTPGWRRAGAALAAAATVVAGGAASAGAQQPVIDPPRFDPQGCARIQRSLPRLADWPTVEPARKRSPKADARIERRVQDLLSKMTLEEKVGQMTQPEINAITPDEVRRHHIGSVLNGGGSWPGGDKHATPEDWLALADAYWEASLAGNARTRIPLLWGIDAVHGNSNVFGATIFPHNIGLGATKDPCLIRRVSAATARQVRATGQDWAFAPTLAVARDDRWGRTYEAFSEDPRVARAYGFEAVRGLQGPGGRSIVATAKHFIGDGGTDGGRDQGVNPSSEAELVNVHGQGYYGAIAAGVHTVMASFNSWENADLGITEGKLHGSERALTDILKGKLGFDGFVVSDWNGIGQVAGCTNASCPQAINAGIDMVMVPHEWRGFIANTIAQVQAGEIPMERIDDAVARILRVKLRSGQFELPAPSRRRDAGRATALRHDQLARKAVRKSLVLLKNNRRVLPLKRTARVLVVGKSADSLQNQTGGWTLTWQGTGNSNEDFPGGTTVLGGLREALGDADVTFDATGETEDPAGYDAVVAVIGETPYAEGNGDLGRRSLEAAKLYPQDLAVLDRVSGRGAPVVTVYIGGRPLYVNKELNRSDAFVAAWLPGTEGGGVADLLVRGPRTGSGFTGKLPFSWPMSPCQTPLNIGDEHYEPLFPVGYGLRSFSNDRVPQLPETSEGRCGGGGGGGPATEDLELLVRRDVDPYRAFIGSPDNWGGTMVGDDPNTVVSHTNISARITDVNVQYDGRRATFNGGPAQFYLQSPQTVDLSGWLKADGALVFDTIVTQAPTQRVVLSMHCQFPCFSEVEATTLFTERATGARTTVKVPLACFDTGALDFEAINTPFLVYTEGAMDAAFANVRWVPGAAKDADAIPCGDLT